MTKAFHGGGPHIKKESGEAKELQREPKKRGIFVDTSGRIKVSNSSGQCDQDILPRVFKQ